MPDEIPIIIIINSVTKQINDLPRIIIKSGNIELFALFDSGASRSLLNEEVYRELNLTNQMKPLESIRLYDVQQRELETLGIVDLTFYCENESFKQKFIVTNAIKEAAILGIDAIHKHNIIINGSNQEIILGAESYNSIQSNEPKENPITMNETTTINVKNPSNGNQQITISNSSIINSTKEIKQIPIQIKINSNSINEPHLESIDVEEKTIIVEKFSSENPNPSPTTITKTISEIVEKRTE